MKLYLIVLSIFASGVVTPTWAKQVVDHTQHTVTIPDHPKRIVSLHDWTITVMAYELGAPVIASTGRVANDGSFFMRGADDLFGLNFNQIQLASVHGQLDLERIMLLKPDLIIASSGDYLAYQDALSSIAPTLMFNPEQGKPILALYEELSHWLREHERFLELKQQYEKKVKRVRGKLAKRYTIPPTYIAIATNRRNGTIDVLKDFGILTTVMDDLGFQRMPITKQLPQGNNRMMISAEMVESINADYILTSYLADQNETQRKVLDDLPHIAPGALGFLKAIEQHHLFSYPRGQVYSPSFLGLNKLLDDIAMQVQ
ncbi:ABC transporter substrate-binding protein [Vibrio tritonius]|uniref:ABC transporter substrate-binding protein n=1 Tax=Vibrio tritonius TaxID=1435069 RepID=UPI00083979B6|nr:ABC transporter substrate-binding protein [Vibrio tritonius]